MVEISYSMLIVIVVGAYFLGRVSVGLDEEPDEDTKK